MANTIKIYNMVAISCPCKMSVIPFFVLLCFLPFFIFLWDFCCISHKHHRNSKLHCRISSLHHKSYTYNGGCNLDFFPISFWQPVIPYLGLNHHNCHHMHAALAMHQTLLQTKWLSSESAYCKPFKYTRSRVLFQLKQKSES